MKLYMGDDQSYEALGYFSANRGTKTIHPRQGKRKRDKWGWCRLCQYTKLISDDDGCQAPRGTGTSIKCHKCGHWVCKDCCVLRKRKGEEGVYFVHCSPRCIKRRPNGKA